MPGGKASTTDAGTHVPLIVSWPGVVPAGSSCHELVDLMPTVIEIAGAELPADRVLDGRSIAPRILGRRASAREALTFGYLPRPRAKDAARFRWAQNARFELCGDGRSYDLEHDIAEQYPFDPDTLGVRAVMAREELGQALAEIPAEAEKIASIRQ